MVRRPGTAGDNRHILAPHRGRQPRRSHTNRARLMNPGLLLQAHNLVLHLQLAALKLGDLQIVCRWMGLGFVDFLFQRLMPSFELRKVRLNGHARFLLMSDGCLTRKVYISPDASRLRFFYCATQQCPLTLASTVIIATLSWLECNAPKRD